MLLSVCLIARDEERFLAPCIESVRPVADEIIVVDTGSTDSTPELARRLGCRVFSFAWRDDFAAARNHALEHARGEWILSIDADERLRTPDLLRQTLVTAPPEVGGFLLYCHSPAGPEGVTSTLVLRLFRRHERIRFRGRIHEQVTVADAGYRIEPSGIVLWHEGYAQGKDVLQAKHTRNRELLELALHEDPDNPYLWLQYARSLLVLGQPAEAVQALERALQLCPTDSPLCLHIHYWYAQTALLLHRPAVALQHALTVLQAYPHQTLALRTAAEAYVLLHQWHHAAALYERLQEAITQQKVADGLLGVLLQISPGELAFRLGRCYIMLGRWDAAEKLLREGIEQDPTHEHCAVTLAHLLITRGRLREANRLIRALQQRRGITPQLMAELLRHRQQRQRTLRRRARPLLSLSMIVRNEADRLPACLESVRDVVDEIVILDTGSDDATPEIARRYGARLYTIAWEDDFAAARNEALRHCTGEWILYLDADERLHPDSASILRDFLLELPDSVGGVICTIESPHRRDDGTRELHRGVYARLFRNYGYPTIAFRGRVHEQISPSLLALGKQLIGSPLRILHEGYDQPGEVLQYKVRRNYQLLIRHVQEEPLDAYGWFQLGQTLARMGLAQEAEAALRFALQLGTLATGVAASAAIVLAQLCFHSRRFVDGLTWAEYALHLSPHNSYALFLKAQALRLLGRSAEAAEILAFLEQIPATEAYFPGDAVLYIDIPREALQRERALLSSSTLDASRAASPVSG